MKQIILTDVAGMDEQTLIRELDREMLEIGNIDAQLRAAEAKAVATGKGSNPEWVAKATSALKIKRRLVSRMQQRAKEFRMGRNNTVAARFMDVAKTILNAETYEMILEAATNIVEDSGNNVVKNEYNKGGRVIW